MNGARASAAGGWPGADPALAIRTVLGELGEDHGLPFLPQLDDRGAPASLLGRGVALLVDLGVDLQPAGWRLTDAPGIDHRRAVSVLRQDLDQLEEQAQDWSGELLLPLPGPLTLAASVERPRGDRILADHGARRELGESYAEGIADLLVELRRRLPAVRVQVQLEETVLAAVLAGSIRTASGFSRHRSVEPAEASGALQRISDLSTGTGAPAPWVLSRGDLDLELVLGSGAGGVVLPADATSSRLDRVAAALESGAVVGLLLEVGPGAGHDGLARRALSVLQPLELGPAIADQVLLSTAGLSELSAAEAVQSVRSLRRAAGIVTDELAR